METLNSLKRKAKFYNLNIEESTSGISISPKKVSLLPIIITLLLALVGVIIILSYLGTSTPGIIFSVAGLSVIGYSIITISQINKAMGKELLIEQDTLVLKNKKEEPNRIKFEEVDKIVSSMSTNPQKPNSTVRAILQNKEKEDLFTIFYKNSKYLNEGANEIAKLIEAYIK